MIFRGVSCCFQTSYVLYAENESKQKKNEELKAENDELRTKISMMDETAICNLRKQKNTEIQRLRNQLTESRRTASYYEVIAEREKKRADNAEGQLNDIFSIPEIKEIWSIQQHIRDFEHQLKTWIKPKSLSMSTGSFSVDLKSGMETVPVSFLSSFVSIISRPSRSMAMTVRR